MTLDELETAVRTHAGEFHCEKIHDKKTTKSVQFAHVVAAPGKPRALPAVGRLDEFYARFGSVVFFHDAVSGDAARHLAAPGDWAELHDGFSQWIEDLDEDELSELLPDGVESWQAIGETPRSGNYILVATAGPAAGQIFEFDHDGYEVVHRGDDVVGYVEKLLKPDGAMLTDIASHMRFIEVGSNVQWWITELRDNRGHVARTRA